MRALKGILFAGVWSFILGILVTLLFLAFCWWLGKAIRDGWRWLGKAIRVGWLRLAFEVKEFWKHP